MLVADLHIHSRFSRATSRNLDPEHLWVAAQLKGVDLLGSGDFTHPAWLEELEDKLVETGDGAYELRPGLVRELTPQVPGPCRRPVRFLLSGEISSIYKRHGRTRKVHSLVLMPDFAAVKRLNARLARLGNITSDGRPILGLDARDLLEICLEVEPSVIFIPAHIWTPWFSVFGSKSGFDSLEECFDDLLPHIRALETGLSSDPPMNWRLSALDGYTLVSHSDAHSPAKLAREADLLDCPPTYPALARALADPAGGGFRGTLEFFPHEGKYHLDGHRKCGLRLEPAQSRELGGRCPKCGGLLTVGVLSRVEELADRPEGVRPEGALDFESLIPLDEVLGEVMGRGPATKGVQGALATLWAELGPELYVLRQAPLEELERVGGPVLAEAVRRMRAGRVQTEGGFDGQFGVVRLFSPSEREEIKGQGLFWRLAPKPRSRARQRRPPSPPAPPPARPPAAPSAPALNPEQERAVKYEGGHLLVRAGPGTGKTRLLVHRAARLLDRGVEPGRLLLVTFTRKAAREMRQRLQELSPGAEVRVATFHALGRSVLEQAAGSPLAIVEPERRQELIRRAARAAGLAPAPLERGITRFKQTLDPEPPPELAAGYAAYQEALEREGVLDLDDLVRRAVQLLEEQPPRAAAWRDRFRHVLVDEYQDVNQAQVALLKLLAGEGTTVMAIGDPDQAIYGFRGADASLFQRFARDFAGARELALVRNYRSSASILAAARALMEQGAKSPVSLRPQSARDWGPPRLIRLPGVRAEARWVAEKVVELMGGLDSRQVEGREKQGECYGARDIAVLYRVHAQAEPLRRALEEAGVPVQVAARVELAELDPLDFRAQRVSLLTMHAAKGLEWPVVFITGLEEGLLPYQPPGRPPAPTGEERRLLFVALTRARRLLFLSRAARRTLYGQGRRPGPSPFLQEIPPGLVRTIQPGPARPRARQLELF